MSAELDKLLNEAVSLRDQGNLPGAKRVLERLLKLFPHEKAVLLVAGLFFWTNGPLTKSRRIFQKATELFPDSGLASISYFHVLWKLERFDDAFEEAKRFLSEYDYEPYLELLADIAGRPETTLETFASTPRSSRSSRRSVSS
jgi:tetratricopeptide (TPR) repeat protein